MDKLHLVLFVLQHVPMLRHSTQTMCSDQCLLRLLSLIRNLDHFLLSLSTSSKQELSSVPGQYSKKKKSNNQASIGQYYHAAPLYSSLNPSTRHRVGAPNADLAECNACSGTSSAAPSNVGCTSGVLVASKHLSYVTFMSSSVNK